MKIFKILVIIFIILGTISVFYSLGSIRAKATITYPPMALPVKADVESSKEMASGDGAIKVSLKIKKIASGNSYTFVVVNVLTGSAQTVYEVNEDSSVSYTIPGNSWAPNDKQFFIVRSTPNETKYFVFKADGSNFVNGQKYLDIGSFWQESKHTLLITDATGWGGEDLIVLTTKQNDGIPGPNFWFVVSSHSFLQLSH